MEPELLLKSLGTVIRERRKALGYSQESFADEIGLHRTYMGAIERGDQNVAFKNLCKIAIGLKAPLYQVLQEAEGLK